MLGIKSKYQTFSALSWPQRRNYYIPKLVGYTWSVWHACFYPIYYPISWLLVVFRITFLVSRGGSPRIGHLAYEPHFYVKATMVGAMPTKRAIMLASPGMVANRSLARYWRKYVTVITNPLIELTLKPLTWMPPTRTLLYPLDVKITNTNGKLVQSYPATDFVFQRYLETRGKAALLNLDPEHEKRGRATLERLGMPTTAWFVALHVREDGYIPSLHTLLRNADIADFENAVRLITTRGGWVVRLGNPTMKPMKRMEGVIDYIFTDARCDWMDVFILGACRFFLGSDSGPYVVPGLFGRPAAVSGIVPMGHGCAGPDDLYIPKLYRDLDRGTLLSIGDVLLTDLRDLWTTEQFQEAGLAWVDNTPSEISALVDEMLDRLENKVLYTDKDEQLQRSYLGMLHQKTTPYTSGILSRVGRDFLRKHKNLLELRLSNSRVL